MDVVGMIVEGFGDLGERGIEGFVKVLKAMV